MEIEPGPGDILLLLDACWNNCDDYPPLLRHFKAARRKDGGRGLRHIAADYPSLFRPITAACFRAWREEFAARRRRRRHLPRHGREPHAGHASDASPRPPDRLVAARRRFRRGERASQRDGGVDRDRSGYFLSVGTLEPRKAYPVAIEAFERLWAAGRDVRL